MRFKNHTVSDMLTAARNEDDGYFEVTRGKNVSINSMDCVSVTITPSHHPRVPATIRWRHGPAVVTREAVERVLNSWRDQ